jgi:hypothetical protein
MGIMARPRMLSGGTCIADRCGGMYVRPPGVLGVRGAREPTVGVARFDGDDGIVSARVLSFSARLVLLAVL